MKKIVYTLFAAMFSFATANAQLLYKVTGNGLAKPSYIFGTFHLANSPFAEKLPGVKQALDETDQVYGELKFDDTANPDSMRMLQHQMTLPQGKTLKTVLTPAQYAKLNKALTEMMGVGLSNPQVAQQMGSLSPAAITTQMQVMQYMAKHIGEFDPTNSIDQYFQLQAKTNNETVGGLETLKFQASVLYGTDLKRQVTLLECFLNNQAYYADLTERMANAYFKQDLNAIKNLTEEKLNSTCDATPEENDKLIYNRNADWAKKMPGIMKAKPTLFAVGAGHLPGERGLLQLLRKAGYSVEAVK